MLQRKEYEEEGERKLYGIFLGMANGEGTDRYNRLIDLAEAWGEPTISRVIKRLIDEAHERVVTEQVNQLGRVIDQVAQQGGQAPAYPDGVERT